MAYGNGLNQGLPQFFETTGVASDISRPYLFRIEIPAITNAANQYQSRGRLTAWCRTAKLPGYTLKEEEIPFQGQKIRIAGPSQFEGEWSVTFLLDEQHTLRAAFMAWMQGIYDPNKMAHSAPKYYKSNDVKVHQLDKTGNSVCTYTFAGAYPKSIGDIELSHESTEPAKMEVSFRYDFFTVGFGTEIDPAAGEGNPTVSG